MITQSQLVAVITSLLAFFGMFFVWAFTHLEQIEILVSWLYRLLAWTGRRTKLKAIATQIQSRINVGSESIESEVQDVMPNAIKIEWITDDGEHASIEEGQVVVRLRNELNNARNIVAATMLYLKAGFLRESRPYIDQFLQEALDLKVAWRLLGTHGESDVAHFFLNEVYAPAVSQDDQIEESCNKLEDLDARGILTRIHIRELRGGIAQNFG